MKEESKDDIVESAKEKTVDPEKLERLQRERTQLLESLAAGNFGQLRDRVGAVLNLHPDARNSDVTLALTYWQMFQPNIFKPTGIRPQDLFKLERYNLLVRARAKIQNEYGLFQADEAIKKNRKGREEAMHEAILADSIPRKVVQIFSDETGKNQDYVIVGSVWALTGRAVFTVTEAIESWRKTSDWSKREIHFASFGKKDAATLAAYLEVIQANKEFLSFKVIAVERSQAKTSIEATVEKLHEHLLIRGAEHEVGTGRVDLPRDIEVTIDHEQSLDKFCLAEIRSRVAQQYEHTYSGDLVLGQLQTANSRKSAFLQLADVVTGAVNRRLNHRGDRGYKDGMSDHIINVLSLSTTEEGIDGLDASALFFV